MDIEYMKVFIHMSVQYHAQAFFFFFFFLTWPSIWIVCISWKRDKYNKEYSSPTLFTQFYARKETGVRNRMKSWKRTSAKGKAIANMKDKMEGMNNNKRGQRTKVCMEMKELWQAVRERRIASNKAGGLKIRCVVLMTMMNSQLSTANRIKWQM